MGSNSAQGAPQDPFLSVVVSVFATAWALPELAARISTVAHRESWSYELILVDDGSPDDAAGRASMLTQRYPAIHYLRMPEHAGQQAAVMAGLSAARGQWTVVLDSDLQDPPEAIAALVGRAQEGFDAVFAARAGSYQGKLRMLTSRLFKAVMTRTCGLPGGAGMFFVASRRLVLLLSSWRDPRPYIVAMIGLSGMPLSALLVTRQGRSQGSSAYSFYRRALLGLSALRFAWRWRQGAPGAREDRSHPSPIGRPNPWLQALGCGALAALVAFVLEWHRPFGIGDEGFRYLLSASWARGEDLYRTFHLLYPAGQYAYYGLLLRLAGPQLWVLRLGDSLLGGLATALIFLGLKRAGASRLAWLGALTIAFLELPTFETVASSLVFLLAIIVVMGLAERRIPSATLLFVISFAAGWLVNWREDSAVLAAFLATIALVARRRPWDTLRIALPAAALGFVPWVALAALRGELASLFLHTGHRLLFLATRLGEPTHTHWRLPVDSFASPRALTRSLFPILAIAPLGVYIGIFLSEGFAWRTRREWHPGALAAGLVGVAYLPQFLWERPDLSHLHAHLHLTLAAFALWLGTVSPRSVRRGLGVAALLALPLVSTAYVVGQRLSIPAVVYPCCEGAAIGARVQAPPPPWTNLADGRSGRLLVLGWGPGWYSLEGIRPASRFLYTGGIRGLPKSGFAELVADLERPSTQWVIKPAARAPRPLRGALHAYYRLAGRWRNWQLWDRSPSSRYKLEPFPTRKSEGAVSAPRR